MKRKRVILTTWLLLLVILSSCAPSNLSTTEPDISPTVTPEALETPTPQVRGETVNVILTGINETGTTKKQQLARLNELVAEKGFNVEFIMCDLSSYGSFDRFAEAYIDLIEQTPNAVFHVWENLKELAINDQNIAKNDVSQELSNNAPRYYQSLMTGPRALEITDCIPPAYMMDEKNDNPRLPCILIPKEIYESYGKEINSTGDYENFLVFAKENYPELTPGAMPIMTYTANDIDATHPPISLLLTEHGYYPLQKVLGDNSSILSLTFSKEGDAFQIRPTESLPEFASSLETLKRWSEDGLVNLLLSDDMARYVPEDYASLFTNTIYCESSSPYAMFSNPKVINFDLSQYYMFIINIDTVPVCEDVADETLSSYSGLMVKNDADASEFYRFLEWLSESEENYRYLHYGSEGVEYDFVDGQIVRTESGANYNTQSALEFFMINKYETANIVLPINYHDEMSTLSYVEVSGLRKVVDNYYDYAKSSDAVNLLATRINNTANLLYQILFLSPSDDINSIVNEYAENEKIRAQTIIDALLVP